MMVSFTGVNNSVAGALKRPEATTSGETRAPMAMVPDWSGWPE